MLLALFYLFVAVLITFYCILIKLVEVKIGYPPFGVLFIAYKYKSVKRLRNFKFLANSIFSRRTHKLVKLCYFNQIKDQIEFAEGVILSEDGKLPDGNTFREAQKAGLNIFSTPAISHAMFIEFPVIMWFPLTKLLAVLIGYPSINHLSKVNNLCAYPVIEIYSKKSVTFVVPLVQQDSFVVHEAESIVLGKPYTDIYHSYIAEKYKYTLSENYLGSLSHSHVDSAANLKTPKLNKRIMKG